MDRSSSFFPFFDSPNPSQVNNNDKLVASSEFHDFLSLNVNGSQLQNICNDLKFFTHGMMGFLDTLRAKIPIFAPSFVNISQDNFFETAETPLECWVYTKAAQVSDAS